MIVRLSLDITDSGLNPTTEMYAVNYVWEWNMTKVVNGDWWTRIVWSD